MKSLCSDQRHVSKAFILVSLLFFCSTVSRAQLSGNYTIGATGDYATFTVAAEALSSLGVSGPVTFNVQAGIYTEQVEFRTIPGTSSDNTVTFQSLDRDSSSVTLQFEANANDNNFVIMLDSVSFMTIRDIGFRALADEYYGRLVEITGTSHDLTFSNNAFFGLTAGDASGNRYILSAKIGDYNPVMYNISIDYNHFSLGSRAIFMQGDNDRYFTGVEIKGNIFDGSGSAGVFLNFVADPVVSYNTIESNAYGIRVNMDAWGGIYSHNRISAAYIGMEVHVSGQSGDRGVIYNNMVFLSESGSKGISIDNSVLLDVMYNSVYVKSNIAESSAFYAAYGPVGDPSVNIRNNNFSNENGGYAVEVRTPQVIKSMDHNNLYTAGNYVGRWESTDYISLSELQEASGFNAATLTVYPHYLGEDNLHTVAPWLNGKGVPVTGIEVDFDGELRDAASPDIGADEFTPDPLSIIPMNGIYTVGSSGDYGTIGLAFEDALLRGTEGGITFVLLEESFNEQVLIRSIPGSGMNKRIILESQTGDPANTVIHFAADDFDANYVIQLHGADFLTIRNLTLRATGSSYARVLDLWQGVDSIEVQGNIVEGFDKTGAIANFALIYSGDSDYHGRRIWDNTLSKGTYGIYMRRINNNDSHAEGTEILDNIIEENGYCGIYLHYHVAPVVTGNKIQTKSLGIGAYSCSMGMLISKNIIDAESNMGLQLSSCEATESEKGLIFNNFIHVGSTGSVQGIHINSSPHLMIVNNSVHLSNTYATSKAFYISSGGSSSVRLANNIFANTGGGYAFYITAPSTVLASDFNDLYTTGGTLAYWGADMADLDALRISGSMEESSISADPEFVSATDLHTMAVVLDSAGLSIAAIPDDIDGDMRDPAFPDIGADEFNILTNSPPVAVNDTVDVYGSTVFFPLLNDEDPDGDLIVIVEIGVPEQGLPGILQGDTSIQYFPADFVINKDTLMYVIEDVYGARDTAYIFITLHEQTGLTEGQAGENQVRLYPVPAGEYLTVDLSAMNPDAITGVKIYDILGREVSWEEQIPNGGGIFQLDLGKLSPGNYFLLIFHDDVPIRKQFIRF